MEVRLLASLHHPSLLRYYEAFWDHGCLCVVTELVHGGDLAALLRLAHPLAALRAARSAWLAGSLAAGHRAQSCCQLSLPLLALSWLEAALVYAWMPGAHPVTLP
jgi:hypothetical protein